MNIVWHYLDKKMAAINALKDYSNMEYILDHTDEDIFKALPPTAITIKVGSHVSAARFFTGNYLDVRGFLKDLALNHVDKPMNV